MKDERDVMSNSSSARPVGLCALCRGINIESLSGEYRHVPNVVELRASSKSCVLCLKILNGFEDDDKLRELNEDRVLEDIRAGNPRPGVPARISITERSHFKPMMCFQLAATYQYSSLLTVSGKAF